MSQLDNEESAGVEHTVTLGHTQFFPPSRHWSSVIYGSLKMLLRYASDCTTYKHRNKVQKTWFPGRIFSKTPSPQQTNSVTTGHLERFQPSFCRVTQKPYTQVYRPGRFTTISLLPPTSSTIKYTRKPQILHTSTTSKIMLKKSLKF